MQGRVLLPGLPARILRFERSRVRAWNVYSAEQNSRIELERCQLDARLIARDQATIEARECVLNGDVHAVGQAVIRLIDCTVNGRLLADPGARLIVE